MNIEIIGYIAACLGAIGYLPQIAHLLKTGSAKDISLLSYGSLSLCSFLWLFYGLEVSNNPLILSSLCALISIGLITFLKIYYDRLHKKNLEIKGRVSPKIKNQVGDTKGRGEDQGKNG